MNILPLPEIELRGKSVIITGASGFIGLNLVRALTGMGAEVLVIDRMQPADHFPGMEFEWADLRHLNKTYECDYLIHLAAITNAGYAEKYPLDTYEVNVLGTVNLLNHVQVSERILFPSTALIYGASQTPLNENSEIETASTYAQSKFLGEQILKFHSDRYGVPHTVVRFFNVYGPGQLPLYIVPQVVRQTMEDGKIVIRNGTVVRDLLFVQDCIEAVLKLAVTPQAANSTFNIGSGRSHTIAEVARAALEASEQYNVEIIDLEENIEYSPTKIIADIEKVQSLIDWSPDTTLERGLKAMFDSYPESRRD